MAVCRYIEHTGLWEFSDVMVITLIGLSEDVALEPTAGTGRALFIVISIGLSLPMVISPKISNEGKLEP
jgi:hypothetical protein